MNRRYVPHTERHGPVHIIGGDGSKWLADIQQEQFMPKTKIDAMRQSAGAARQQQQMNRLQHSRWPHEVAKPGLSWTQCVLIGLGIAGAILFALLQGELPV